MHFADRNSGEFRYAVSVSKPDETGPEGPDAFFDRVASGTLRQRAAVQRIQEKLVRDAQISQAKETLLQQRQAAAQKRKERKKEGREPTAAELKEERDRQQRKEFRKNRRGYSERQREWQREKAEKEAAGRTDDAAEDSRTG